LNLVKASVELTVNCMEEGRDVFLLLM
jgi:hypothetical protein